MNIERLYLDVQTGRNLDKIAEECFELLARQTASRLSCADETVIPYSSISTRRSLAASLPGNADEPGRPQGREVGFGRSGAGLSGCQREGRSRRYPLEGMQYQLLVALDRPQDLAKRLEAWIAAGDADNGWRLILGYLDAETGKIPAAITLFEAVRAADELSGADYRTLADWYMAVNRRDDYDRARVETFKVIDEWRLNQWLYGKLRPWQYNNEQQPPPRELDVEVLYAFTALFEKASQPQNYLYQLQQFYAATRDFRLLAGLADAVLGHTAGQVYPFVQGMSGVLARFATRPRPTRSSSGSRGPRTGQDRRGPPGPRPLGTARRTPRHGSAEPARPARREGIDRHAAGLEAGVVARRAAADGRLAGIAGAYHPTAAGQ